MLTKTKGEDEDEKRQEREERGEQISQIRLTFEAVIWPAETAWNVINKWSFMICGKMCIWLLPLNMFCKESKRSRKRIRVSI